MLRRFLAGLAHITISLVLAACSAGGPPPVPTPEPALTGVLPAAQAAAATATPVPPTAAPTPKPTSTATTVPSTAIATPLPPPATATSVPPTVTPAPVGFDPAQVSLALEPAVSGLNEPVFATHAGDGSGRLFVLEKPGVVVVVDAAGSRPFLDIRERVGSAGYEQGLLGLAFHPDFAANGRLFVYYTDRGGGTVIARFQANDERSAADPAGEVVLLAVAQPAANHNGGMLAFGPDGYLYVGLGDGGAANDRFGNGQNLGTLLGTIIRLDVDSREPYAVPAGNPFVAVEGARPEIWAYGLRNPWRFSFDRATGDLFIGDVGQNQYEEIHVQPAGSPGGENYGWPIMEGLHCFGSGDCDLDGLQLPVAEYPHSQGCSVTGGVVYRGTAQPSLQGAYFYGDFCTGIIWALSQGPDGAWQNSELLRSGLSISSFGETEAGEVLVVDLGGAISRLVDQK